MWGIVISSILGAVVGGVTQGVATAKANEEKVAAYEQAAQSVREATDKYSGENAYNEMMKKGAEEAKAMSDFTSVAPVVNPAGPGQTTGNIAPIVDAANQVANETKSNYNQGWNMGQSNAGTMNAAKYNADLAKANIEKGQADVNFNVANQAQQETLKGIGNIAQTGSNIANTVRKSSNGRNIAE